MIPRYTPQEEEKKRKNDNAFNTASNKLELSETMTSVLWDPQE